jgi:hypothetical protein
MQTVAELFRQLEEQRVRYAVLRNYELLPELRGGHLERNTDIDLVIDSRDLPRFRKLVTSLAAEFDWDVLTECRHFQRSRARHHNIEIFQFYRLGPLDYLQIDVFHGYLAWGLPLMDEQEMLHGRVHDRTLGLTRIDPAKENAFRVLQIHGLGQEERTADKRARYRAKIEAFRAGQREKCLTTLRRYLGAFGVEAVNALLAGDTLKFLRAVARGKAYFFARYALRHPVSTLWQVAERFRENRKRFHGDPCGCFLTAHAATDRARCRFQIAMATLMKLNVLDEWVEQDTGNEINARLHNILEQGGIVVQWTDRDRASVIAEPGDDPDEIAVKVLNAYVPRHPALYSNPLRCPGDVVWS